MRVLVLSYETPAYPAGGGPSRQHSLLEPLAVRHNIRVLSTGGPPQFGRLPQGVDVRFLDAGEPYGHPPGPWLAKHARHYLGTDPWLHRPSAHHRAALGAALPAHLAEFAPDLVMVEHGDLGPLVEAVPPRLATVLVLHNVFWSVQVQKLGNGLVETVNTLFELPIVARRERADAMRATRVVTVTDHDAHLVRRLARRANVAVVPNCVDTEYFRRRHPPADRPTVIMTASYHYPPNQLAAVELLDHVFPIVRQRVPDAELLLVGQQMPPDLARRAAAQAGVRVVGQVDDIRPQLEQAWVAVAPLRKGSGSPLKVIEALAAGVPVVVSRRVTEAFGADAGLLTADSAPEMGARIGDLLADRGRRDRLAAAGEELARSRFDRVPVSQRLEAVWTDAVRTTRPTQGNMA